MNLRFARTGRQAAFWLAAAILLGICALTWRSTTRLLTLNNQANRTMEVQYGLQQLLGSLVDAEAGVRGYLVTGEEDFLEPYFRGVAAAPDLLATPLK
jgi:methyl-accepting chemotaxis protein